MARPFPWLGRLPDIRRAVSNSVRSHFDRRGLELLFGISSRAAGRLLELLATDRLTQSHLVSREALQAFLESVATASDVPRLIDELRAERVNLSRVKTRYFFPHDQERVTLPGLPDSIRLQPGELRIRYEGLEDLCGQMMLLGKAMQDDPLGFEAACEPRRREDVSLEAQDARYIAAEIERMKAMGQPAV